MLEHTPRFDLGDAERVALEHYGVDGVASELTSERDQNFCIEDYDGTRIVLKIANAREDRAMLEAQQRLLTKFEKSFSPLPRLLLTTDGESLVSVTGQNGAEHLAWAISWLPGRPLAEVEHRTPALYHRIGSSIGYLDAALKAFDDPALHRDFYWDLRNGRSIVSQYRGLITDRELGRSIDRLMASYDEHAAGWVRGLPGALIHGDLNDRNILIDGLDRVDLAHAHVSGIVDLGDMVFSYRIADLAIAIAYAMLGQSDPLAIMAEMVSGFRSKDVIYDNEHRAIFGLVVLRLCMSVCIAADQQRRRPDNEYLGVSQSAIARLLPILAGIPFPLANSIVRNAADPDYLSYQSRLVQLLHEMRDTMPPILGVDPQRAPSIVLDLSVDSPLLSGNPAENSEPLLTERISAAMRAANVKLAIGRYNEPRLIYAAPAFDSGNGPYGEHRTIHIGLDLFADVGTPVFAPLDGVVHAFADNKSPQDYGPVIVLRHELDEYTEFYTLYGHLSRKSLDGLTVGMPVKAGDKIATLGPAEVNGGWTPHLHFQIIKDDMELGTDFPGVAPASQRDAWRILCPDPNLIARVPADRFPEPVMSTRETLGNRSAVIGRNVSISYREPLNIVRGWMQHLYDAEGRRYLDAYNNVPHVGHCHPRVVEAAARQMRVLNTNTRYLNRLLAEYAGRLLATLQPSLEVCYVLNSASEANELALRLTRAYTGRRDMIVLDSAYHGNTTSLIDISPYKHDGPGGNHAPGWVHVAALPDLYRGRYKASDPDAGAKYAEFVRGAIRRTVDAGRYVAGFIAETCPSVGGQLLLPPGYLAQVYEYVRAVGGVCIADEVQTGLGRMGTSFWAFEDQNVVPDIVVMGKPLGNGHPLAAVATTRAIAQAFDNGMEFFSTFGGNTVSCAVGIAVLDVVRDEKLQDHALKVGESMGAKLRALIDRHEIVGDVRGSGLFWGVELVRDRETLEPADAEASVVVNRMRERGVLVGTDGPHHNVIKIRPPMPFTAADGDLLVEELDRALHQIPTLHGL